MTLILSVITPGYVLQASDRRVVSLRNDGAIVPMDNARNKAVVLDDRITFAYTGLADIGGWDPAEFVQAQLADELGAGRTLEVALNNIGTMWAQQLQQFRSLHPDFDSWHALVGVGWSDEPHPARRTPSVVCVSNGVDVHGNHLSKPMDEFQAYRRILDPAEPFSVFVAGVPISDETCGHLHARLGAHTTTSDDPAPAAQILIEAIRAESARSDAVGRGVMVNCLPQCPSPPGEMHFIGGPPEHNACTFTYVPDDADAITDEYLGPLRAFSNGHRMDSYVATGLPEGTHGMMFQSPTASPLPRAAIGQRVRPPTPGRNDPCWCGSGNKYKKCHGP